MNPRNFSSEAIILARKNYSEADRILILFTKSHGKLPLIAKGIRNPKSRKRGSLEVFSRIKFTASVSRSLGVMTEAEMIDNYPKIRRSIKKTALAYFFMESVGRLTSDSEENIGLFSLLDGYLKKLESEKKLKLLKELFILDCLVLLGFWPKGKKMVHPEMVLESIIERPLNSIRVGRKLVS